MALGTTNISLDTVADLLAGGTATHPHSLFTIGTSANINKWSKYKPICDAGAGANWPAGTDSHYGLNLVNGSLTSNWDYLHPTGGSWGGSPDEPVRLGDFRGYEHTQTLTMPPVYNTLTGPTTMSPHDTSYAYSWNQCNIFNDSSSVRIRTSDLGINTWYLGIKIETPSSGTYYKTYDNLGTTKTNSAVSIACELSISGTTFNGFSNLPWSTGDGVGSYNWYLMASNTQKSSWNGTAPTTYYYLPEETCGGSTLDTHGSFSVTDWVYVTQGAAEDYTASFTAAGGYEDFTVHCSYSGGPPDWAASEGASHLSLGWRTTEGGSSMSESLVTDGNAVRITATAIADYSDVVCIHDTSDGYTWTMGAESGDVDPTLTRSNADVTITSNSKTRTITVSQGTTGDADISFTYNPNSGGDFPPSGATINYKVLNGSSTQVYPSSGWASATGQKCSYNNPIGPVTMTTTAGNETYTVYIKLM